MPVLLRELGDVDYDVAEFAAFLAEDAAWRARNPRVVGGPLRDSKGRMAPVPAFMRLDYYTDRNGPVSEHRPDLGPCWVWTGVPVKGYGYIRVGKRKVQAYRVNYERWVGPIPAGAVMDHLCRNRVCVHPLHVEPTTYSENTRRSPIHASALNAAKTHCPEGHLYDEQNTAVKPGGMRRCRRCDVGVTRRYKVRQRARRDTSVPAA